MRAMRFSMLCAIAAFVALAPNRSTMFCRRATSLACSVALRARRSSSSLRALRYCVYVPRYSTRWPTASSAVAVEVEHARDRLVEQFEVVADHQQRAAVGAQEPHQPGLGVDVEVVRRLVEQQHVGAGEQDAGELDPPALAAREHPERQVEAVGAEAEAGGERRASLSAL